MPYFVYLVRCADNSFYCGYTTDLTKRLHNHNNSKVGAKYTRTKRPVALKYFEEFSTRSNALKREYVLKQLSHKNKQDLVNKFNYQINMKEGE